jgi:serine/threonine protein kinase
VLSGGTTSSYEVLARIASGGMAEVFLARVTSEASIERYVVLKRVLPELATNEAFVTMFLDEARLAAQLRHPNIAQLYDVGRLGTSYFYTMEYIHGATAWLLMQRASALATPIPLAHVLTIAANISAALHHAHTRVGANRQPLGIVHRDVTPANIMISNEGVVKLLDFGVAKAQGRRTTTLVGTIKGKIAYLSPEQCTPSSTIDGRSDVFSLGIVLYELLTLHQLFQRVGDLPTMTAIVHEQVPPPSYFRPDVPPEVDRIVMTALAKDPAERFANADVMHQTVEDVAATLGISTSVTALARYMTSLFGQPPEPWLALEPTVASAVTVIAAPLAPLDTTVPRLPDAPTLSSRDSADLDERIRNLRPSAPRLENNPESSQPSLPLASAHPGWEETISRAPIAPLAPFGGFEHLDRTAPESRTGFEDDPDLQTVVDPGSGAQMAVPGVPMERPIAPRGVITPPPITLRVAPVRELTWNVPRLVIAAAIVIVIVVALIVLLAV